MRKSNFALRLQPSLARPVAQSASPVHRHTPAVRWDRRTNRLKVGSHGHHTNQDTARLPQRSHGDRGPDEREAQHALGDPSLSDAYSFAIAELAKSRSGFYRP